jgi:HSP20 family protein
MIMYLTAYEPWNILNQFRNELDQVFGHQTRPVNGDSAIATSNWVPSVDIKEEKQGFLIEADIPGVAPKDIEISMENGVLTIKGERRAESQEDGKNYKRVERTYGSFYRRFSLPDTADAEKITASGKNGVLQISIPKQEIAKPRKIKVQA